jgi:hypothetical protein
MCFIFRIGLGLKTRYSPRGVGVVVSEAYFVVYGCDVDVFDGMGDCETGK